ncbi:type III restriction endonuclease [Alphaproteobacteria bacterium]|nr:type III restriction endonuclease [Alphaproteobacteria bacterium]
MELKQFQQAVINDLSAFLSYLGENTTIAESYRKYWESKSVPVGLGGMESYRNMLDGVPNICLKVPTSGGKTFIASCALRPIFDALPHTKTKAVVWLVPSDAILEQTMVNLKNVHHPYRRRINTDFSHHVAVYDKDQLLSAQNFSPTSVNEQLSIFVLSYDSFRTSKKDGRKAYQQNGSLAAFSQMMNNPDVLLADTDEIALIQVIRALNPVVVVDESHHAASSLSKEMLLNFNPAFVLDLTATPKKESNIISYVDALQLKKENMVKLPVIVYNRRNQTDVLIEAINIRNKLEAAAVRERQISGRYIRPIALIQAEPKNSADSTTFEKIKKHLLECGIPKGYIAIKTADKNELKGVDLLSKDCSIRYIITVNALKEGWDCSFAYVLATIANRSSQIDVEQILGRILRLPNVTKSTDGVLNISYCITSSTDFQATLTSVVAGLNHAGFSEKDYRSGTIEEQPIPQHPAPPTEQIPLLQAPVPDDNISFDPAAVREATFNVTDDPISASTNDPLFALALQQAQQYEKMVSQSGNAPFGTAVPEVREKMNVFTMNDEYKAAASALRLPQFVTQISIPMLTGESTTLLTREKLTEGFTLHDKDTMINFSSLDAEIAQVDLTESGNATPKAWKLSGRDSSLLRKYFRSQSQESRIRICFEHIRRELSKNNVLDDRDITGYVTRIIGSLTAEQLEELQESPEIYLVKIRKKISSLLDAHRERQFDLWIEQGKILSEPTYALPKSVSPTRSTKTLVHTLYTAEEEMNGLEAEVALELASMSNILWWHRNISRSGFCINGFINAYPDIIAMTKNGKILLIEPKGDHLENTESRQKVENGCKWQRLAGAQYRYYMVFRQKDWHIEGAYRYDRFLEIVREL